MTMVEKRPAESETPAPIEPTGRLIIKNLCKNVDEKQLLAAFSKHGDVTDCRIMRDKKTGESRRFAFVGYREVEAAVKGKKFFNNAYIGTGKVAVDHAAKVGEYMDPKKLKALRHQEREAEKIKKAEERVAKAAEKNKPADKLTEYVDTMMHKKGRKVWADDAVVVPVPGASAQGPIEDDVSDAENVMVDVKAVAYDKNVDDLAYLKQHVVQGWSSDEEDEDVIPSQAPTTADFADSDEEMAESESEAEQTKLSAAQPQEVEDASHEEAAFEDTILDHGRLRIVNLPYSTTNESLSQSFSKFGPVREVHICKDDSTNKSRGFGFVSFAFPEHAVRCLAEAENGLLFEGRIVKVHEAKTRSREFQTKLEESKELFKKSFRAKREEERRANAHKQQHTWNLLYVSSNAAVTALADQLGLQKHDIMDLSAGDLAVRAAIAETEVIKRTSEWLKNEGIRVNAFERKGEKIGAVDEQLAADGQHLVTRSKTTIIAKHLPVNFDEDELRAMFARVGILAKFLISPTKTVAIIQYCEEGNASRGFSTLAFRRLKSVPLYLEWAPEDLFVSSSVPAAPTADATQPELVAAPEPVTSTPIDGDAAVATLFVKNLAFSTTQAALAAAFQKTKGFVKATVATKVSPSGEKLSSGYGFVDFRSVELAKEALKKQQNIEIDGKKLDMSMAAGRRGEDQSGAKVIKAMDSAELMKRASSRLSVKNIAFQATKEELKKLFATYGNVVSVRLPQKVGERQHRGFAFVEFMSKEDAVRAYEALQHTHLYGRRLIVEPAEVEAVSVDALQMQAEKRMLIADGMITTESKRRKLVKDL